MTDFRELCAELVTELEKWCGTYSSTEDSQSVINRARAALAEPEPEGPTDEELVQTAIDTRLYRFQATAGDPIQYEMTEQQIHAFARAILSRWGNNNTSWSN